MSTRLARLFLGSTLLGAAASSTASASPPGLPIRHLDLCEVEQLDPTAGADQVRKEDSARRMYEIAEKCRKGGDAAMARNCYEETRLLCPGSRYAQLAAERLQLMSDDGEAQDRVGPPERATQQLRPIRESKADVRRLAEARVLYALGERCRIHDDDDMAYRFYQDSVNACPQSRYAVKSAERMRAIDLRRAGRAIQGESGEGLDELQTRQRIEPALPGIDPLVVTWLERVAELFWPKPQFFIVPEDERPAGAEEAQEPPAVVGNFPQTEPPPLFVAGPVGELRLADEPARPDPFVTPVAAEDLSDWFRQTVRVLRGAGSLRIDAARLARLMGEGEQALRELNCSVEYVPFGQAFVVYPRR